MQDSREDEPAAAPPGGKTQRADGERTDLLELHN